MSRTGDAVIDAMNAEDHNDCPQCGGTGRICRACESSEEECQCPAFSEGAPCPYVVNQQWAEADLRLKMEELTDAPDNEATDDPENPSNR